MTATQKHVLAVLRAADKLRTVDRSAMLTDIAWQEQRGEEPTGPWVEVLQRIVDAAKQELSEVEAAAYELGRRDEKLSKVH